MTNLVAFVAIALILWLTFYVFIPRASKLIALYGLHGLRDRLYRAARGRPAARSTLVYRDVEYVLCVCINIVRERDHLSAVGLAQSMAPSNRPATPEAAWRLARYKEELRGVFAASEGGIETLEEILDTNKRAVGFVLIRAVGGHPVPVVIALVGFVFLLARLLTRQLASTSPVQLLSRSVAEIEARPTPRGTNLQGLRLALRA